MAFDDSDLDTARKIQDIRDSEVSPETDRNKTQVSNSVDTNSLKKVQLNKLKRNLSKTIKSMTRDGKFLLGTDLSQIGLGSNPNPTITNFLLTAVTEALIHEGLWKDEAEEIALSEAFPASQANQDRAL